MKNNKNIGSFLAGKGYYIALALCAVAIGITGYLYYRNVNQDPSLQDPGHSIQNPTDDVQAGLTLPGDPGVTTPDPTRPSGISRPGPLKTGAPLQGETLLGYCMDCLGYNPTTRDWRTHDGIDIAAESGTAVSAAADGTVYTIFTDESMGTTVVIRHQDGYVTTYASLGAEVPVSVGDTVKLGQTIGYVGNSAVLESAIGDHLHFSVACNGQIVDPESFLSRN